jgi:hypothetical protein
MADAAPMDDDTTATSGEVDPQDVADAQSDNAQTSTTDRGRATAERLLTEGENMASGKDPAQASLIAQYGLNAQQARAILQRARDTLAQNAPQMINLAAAQHMSNPGGWGQIYAGSMGAAANAQQDINKQLAGYDLSMVQAGQGGLDAQLKMLTNRLAFYDKVAPAAMRVEGLPPAPAAKAPSGEAQNYEQLLKDSLTAQGLQEGTPEYQQQYSHGLKAFLAKQQHFTDPTAQASMITPDAKELAYQYFKQNNALPPGFSRNPTMTASMLNYVAQRAGQEGETEIGMMANNQANKASQAVVKDFSSPGGKAGASLNAINTSVMHMDSLLPLVDAMGGGDLTAVNKVSNWFKQQTGQTAPNNFNAIKEFVGGEVAKAVLPSGGGELERRELTKVLDAANSPDQLKQAISQIQVALAGKTDALRTQWDAATHGNQGDFSKFLGPTTKRVLGVQDVPAAGTTPPAKIQAPQAALDHLKAHPELAPAFKAKYGYLPGAQ